MCIRPNYFNDLFALLEKGLALNPLFSVLINSLYLEALLLMTRNKLILSKEWNSCLSMHIYTYFVFDLVYFA